MAFKTSKLAHFNINSPWLCHVYIFLKGNLEFGLFEDQKKQNETQAVMDCHRLYKREDS